MPGPSFISNTFGAHRNVTTFVEGQDSDGHDLFYGQGEVYNFRANGTISRGNALAFIEGTASNPLSVAAMATTDDPSLFAGIALHDAVADDHVHVMRHGFARVTCVVADDPVFGDILTTPDTTAGLLEATAAPAGSGTSSAGVGIVVADEIDAADNTGLAIAYIGWVARDDLII